MWVIQRKEKEITGWFRAVVIFKHRSGQRLCDSRIGAEGTGQSRVDNEREVMSRDSSNVVARGGYATSID